VTFVGVPYPYFKDGLLVRAVLPTSVATTAGLEPGDVVLKANSQPLGSSVRVFSQILMDKKGETVSLEVSRESRKDPINLQLVPPEEGPLGLMVEPQLDGVRPRRASSPREALSRTNAEYARLVGFITSQLQAAVDKPEEAKLAGPIAIAQMGQGIAEQGGVYGLLLFTALLNLNLAALNALPIPGLDGGQLAILLVETAARRKLNKELVATVTTVCQLGIVLLAFSVFSDELRGLFSATMRNR